LTLFIVNERLNGLCLRIVDVRTRAKIVLSLSVFLGKNVIFARASSFNLAGGGYFESLFRRAFGFHFRHIITLR